MLFTQACRKDTIYKEPLPLPEVFEDYVRFYKQTRQAGYKHIYRIRGTLSALHAYLQGQGMGLKDLDVFHMVSIPKAARIFTISDVWDALSHPRVYKKGRVQLTRPFAGLFSTILLNTAFSSSRSLYR